MAEILLFKGGVISDDRGRIICLKEENGEIKIFEKGDKGIAYNSSQVSTVILPGGRKIVVGSELWADDYYYTIRGEPPIWLHPVWRRRFDNITRAIELADKLSEEVG